jgi:hypothetical protein
VQLFQFREGYLLCFPCLAVIPHGTLEENDLQITTNTLESMHCIILHIDLTASIAKFCGCVGLAKLDSKFCTTTGACASGVSVVRGSRFYVTTTRTPHHGFFFWIPPGLVFGQQMVACVFHYNSIRTSKDPNPIVVERDCHNRDTIRCLESTTLVHLFQVRQ